MCTRLLVVCVVLTDTNTPRGVQTLTKKENRKTLIPRLLLEEIPDEPGVTLSLEITASKWTLVVLPSASQKTLFNQAGERELLFVFADLEFQEPTAQLYLTVSNGEVYLSLKSSTTNWTSYCNWGHKAEKRTK
ncbi:uncharacterized protein LOC129925229 [Biomphalaria glabrata]|uniref:Uncharacterized protein LOC129925229 n=1 Tax=Biomphalaria glabrata TaxID=6526 RepID=A0A9W2ZZS2_BIOGL|nr:uncharacterized protein LOC129925229 [Biomphalaria glabrata]